MSRTDKKCLVASTISHSFLALLLLVGSAFFMSTDRPPTPIQALKQIPSRLVENALAGGGGNQNLVQSDERVKGNTLQSRSEPPPPVKNETPPPIKRVEPVKPVVDNKTSVKPTPVKNLNSKPTEPKVTPDKMDLKLVVRNPDQKKKAEADAKAQAERDNQRQWKKQQDQIAKVFDKGMEDLKSGFTGGTKVEVGGPGSVAYANYAQFVQAVYSEAWKGFQDLMQDDLVTVVEVTILRDGTVASARIINRSKDRAMDSSVQRALDRVKSVRPFPDETKDAERRFTIEFNLKAKKLLG